MTIHKNLQYFARRQPEKTCLTYAKTSLSYGEFAAITEDIALRLASQYEKGTKIIIKQDNPINLLLYLYGAIQAGLVMIPIDPNIAENLLQTIIAKTKTRIVIDQPYVLPSIKNKALPNVVRTDLFLGAVSSGSTGQPKVIWRDHQSWSDAFPFQGDVFNLDSTDRLFLINALAYTGNLNSCVHILNQGGSVFFSSKNWPRSWVKEILEYQITAIFMVPANYRILLKVIGQPLSPVKSIVSAGAKMDLETLKLIQIKFPKANFYEYYGASELGHVSYNTQEDLLRFPDSVGKAFPGVKFWLEQERIMVESPYLAPEYRPGASVGDLGRINSEGYLFYLGRENGMINKGGVKIVPEQVENIIRKCPGVEDVLVTGENDLIKGQKVIAWVVPQNKQPAIQDLREFCKENLNVHQRPEHFYFTDSIPRNSSGKVIRSIGSLITE